MKPLTESADTLLSSLKKQLWFDLKLTRGTETVTASGLSVCKRLTIKPDKKIVMEHSLQGEDKNVFTMSFERTINVSVEALEELYSEGYLTKFTELNGDVVYQFKQ